LFTIHATEGVKNVSSCYTLHQQPFLWIITHITPFLPPCLLGEFYIPLYLTMESAQVLTSDQVARFKRI